MNRHSTLSRSSMILKNNNIDININININFNFSFGFGFDKYYYKVRSC